jgi:hypothetical protein
MTQQAASPARDDAAPVLAKVVTHRSDLPLDAALDVTTKSTRSPTRASVARPLQQTRQETLLPPSSDTRC